MRMAAMLVMLVAMIVMRGVGVRMRVFRMVNVIVSVIAMVVMTCGRMG